MHETIVGSNPDRALLKRRFGNRENRAVRFLETAAVFLLFVVSREIRTDRLPTLALGRRPEQNVAGGIHHVRIQRRNNDRECPLEPIVHLGRRPASRIVRPDRDIAHLSGSTVESRQLAEITSAVYDVTIRARGNVAALSTTDGIPLGSGRRGAARDRTVVLSCCEP